VQTRDGIERAYQLEFRASLLMWGELRNPYGPARHREMRSFTIDEAGGIHSTVIVPAGWPANIDNGRRDDWDVAIVDGTPRTLRVSRSGAVEIFEEGPMPAPASGLTAVVYSFAPGGAIDDAFCDSGTGGFDYDVLLGAARGATLEQTLAPLLTWQGGNAFAVTDVAGFGELGGSHLTSQANFVVRYFGTLHHPGGTLRMRELDDTVEDGVWVFLNDAVGSSSTARLFLEVHGFAWADKTPDSPEVTMDAGDIPVEVILYRCTEPVIPVDVQIDLGTNLYQLLGDADTEPDLAPELFPRLF
jgi:hypothetical protein